MELDEWRVWWSETPAAARAGLTPCLDCPIDYAVAMRREGRCNGTPGSGPRHPWEEQDDAAPVPEQAAVRRSADRETIRHLGTERVVRAGRPTPLTSLDLGGARWSG